MKQILVMMMAVVLGGCGNETKEKAAKAKAAWAEIDERVKAKAKTAAESKAAADAKIIKKAISEELEKPKGKLTKADYEKVTELNFAFVRAAGGVPLTELPKGLEKLTQLKVLSLHNNELTEVKNLEKLTELTELYLPGNKLTEVKSLEKLIKLEHLWLFDNPNLTKSQIDELKKALPNCDIRSNPKK